jgi:hypothetical protein
MKFSLLAVCSALLAASANAFTSRALPTFSRTGVCVSQ